MNRHDAAVKLKKGLKSRMGELRYMARTRFGLDLSDLSDREIIQIIYKACDLYLSETTIKGVKVLELEILHNPDSTT